MKLLPITLCASTLVFSGCTTTLPKMSAVQAGDAQLSCYEIPEEIARMDAIIEKIDDATKKDRLVKDAAGIGITILQGALLEEMGDLSSAAMITSGAGLVSGLAGMLTDDSARKAQRTLANATERKAILKQLYYTRCFR